MSYLFHNFFALTIGGLTLGAIYALVALGYTLVYGVLRLINFAHSEVFMFGTFGAVWLLIALGAHGGGSTARSSATCCWPSSPPWSSPASSPCCSNGLPTGRSASATPRP